MIYLDNHATTRVDPRVLDAMLPCYGEGFANASSLSHAPGRAAAAAVAHARQQVAALLGARPEEIVFTSGATEANNLALLGTARLTGGGHLVTSAIEHPAILETAERSFDTTLVPVGPDGRISAAEVERALRPDTRLVSVMAANNEIGTIQPIAEIGRLCRQRGVRFHTDASQAIGKVPIDVERDSIDLLSLTGHKFHGPVGCGALFVRNGVELPPIQFGGAQEGGRRSGTLNLPGIVGLGAACAILTLEGAAECERIGRLRDRLLARLEEGLGEVTVNGPREGRLAANLHVSFRGVPSAALMAACPDLAVSAGAACHSESSAISPVLAAIGCDEEGARGAVRFGLGRFNTEAEIDAAARMVIEAVKALKT